MKRRSFLKMFVAGGLAVGAGVKVVYEKIKRPSVTEVVKATLEDPDRQKKLANNIKANNALLKRLEV